MLGGGGTQQEMMMSIKWIKINDIDVRYDIKKPAKASMRVIILPGFTECIEKHFDQTEGFASMGAETLCLDWPGQGLSSRLSGHPTLIHCPDFRLHLEAIESVIDDAGIDDQLPLFIFGHSMGGHLGLRLAGALASERGWHVRGVILSAPMMMLPIWPGHVMQRVLDVICCLGFARWPTPRQKSYVRGGGEFQPSNLLTRDPEGYALQYRLFEDNPALKCHGPSYGWVRAALRSCLATTRNPDWLKAFALPVQAHLAEDERVVHPSASAKALAHIQEAEIHVYEGARHELMVERPEVRQAIWRRMAEFIQARK